MIFYFVLNNCISEYCNLLSWAESKPFISVKKNGYSKDISLIAKVISGKLCFQKKGFNGIEQV